MGATGSLTLIDPSGNTENLIVTKISYSIQPTENRVFGNGGSGNNSAWTQVPTVDVENIQVTFQPQTNMEYPMEGNAGYHQWQTLKRWAELQTLLTLQGEEVNIINWNGIISSMPYQWDYSTPSPTCTMEIQSAVNWVYDYAAGNMSPAELNELWSDGLVTQNAMQVLKNAEKAHPHYFHGALFSIPSPAMKQVNKILKSGQETLIERNADGSLNINWKGKKLNHVFPSDQLMRNLLSN